MVECQIGSGDAKDELEGVSGVLAPGGVTECMSSRSLAATAPPGIACDAYLIAMLESAVPAFEFSDDAL